MTLNPYLPFKWYDCALNPSSIPKGLFANIFFITTKHYVIKRHNLMESIFYISLKMMLYQPSIKYQRSDFK